MNIKNGNKSESRFRKKSKPKNLKGTINRLLNYFKEDKKTIRLILFLVVLDSILVIAVPYLIGKIVDIIQISDNFDYLFINSIVILLVFYLIEFIEKLTKGILTAKLSQKIVKNMRSNIFLKLQNLPISFFQRSSNGDIMSRFTNDIDNISTGISNSMVQFITGILNIFLTFIMMMFLSPILTVLSLILIPMVLFLSKYIASKTRNLFKEQQIELGKLNAQVEEIISYIDVVKAFNYEEKSIYDFKNINKKLVKVSLKAQIYTSLLMPLMNVISNIGFAIICIIGGILASKEIITIGIIASFLSYVKQFTRPLNEIANLFNTSQSALAGCERVFEVLDEVEECCEDSFVNKEKFLTNKYMEKYVKSNNIREKSLKGNVEFKDVYFSYNNKNNILKGINLKIVSGTSNAIIGETGSGKTTIVNLITNFYNIKEGIILIDGENIKNYNKNSLRSSFGVVPQESYLFYGTIMDNIRYGKLDATDEEVIKASKIANSHNFITNLDKGYDTILSEQGEGLSEGQRQLISIARTMLRDPDILILDEATSSIDTTTESKIQEAINSIMKDRTTIIIAHRLSTIYNCDNIIVLRDGIIEESGSHQELIKKKGIYYKNILMTKGEK